MFVVNENTNNFNGIYKIKNNFRNIYRIKNFKNNITAQKGRNTIYYFNKKQNKLIKHPIDIGKDSYNILLQIKDYLIITKTILLF